MDCWRNSVVYIFIIINFCFLVKISATSPDLFQQAQNNRYGNETSQDLHKAVQILKQTAGLSNIDTYNIEKDIEGKFPQREQALFALGEIFQFGEGGLDVRIDLSFHYFNKCATEFGNATAQYLLGFFYGSGKTNGTIDRPLSLVHLAFSALGENTEAHLSLGNSYLYGHGTIKSCTKAAGRYQRVAEKVVNDLKERTYKQVGPTLHSGEFIRLADSFDSPRDRSRDEFDIVQYYQYSADSGDVNAQVTMGTLFLQGGYGLEQNYENAFHYFQAAASQGDLNAISNLAFMYSRGLGTNQDNDTALKLFQDAATKGHPQAQTNLGFMYLHGYGVTKSVSEALQHFKMAAEQGYPEAQLNLGTMHYEGDGIKQDYGKALTYFSLAAQHGNLIALYNLADMHLHGLGTTATCPVAVQLYKKVAERGSLGSLMVEAYSLFQSGDISGSLMKYEQASLMGCEVAQHNAAWIYDKYLSRKEFQTMAGIDLKQRFNIAMEYYKNAAEQKNHVAYLRLGDFYFDGLGTSLNYEKAVYHYQAAAEMRNAQAMFNLGFMHQYGLGIPRDLHLAKRYYDMALQTEPDSFLAVYSALTILAAQHFWDSNFSLEAVVQMFWPPQPIQQLQFQQTTTEQLMEWDTLLIMILTGVLIVVLFIRYRY